MISLGRRQQHARYTQRRNNAMKKRFLAPGNVVLQELLCWRNGLEDGWCAGRPAEIGLQRSVVDRVQLGRDPAWIEKINLGKTRDSSGAVTHATEFASIAGYQEAGCS